MIYQGRANFILTYDQARRRRLPEDRTSELLQHAQEVKAILLDLERRLRKYENLGVKARVTFDRLGWDQQEYEMLRNQISSRVTMLNNFYLTVIASAQSRLQRAMDQIVKDLRSGRRGLDSVSSITTEHDVSQDDPAWRSLIEDLELQGISKATIRQYSSLIVERIVESVNEHTLVQDTEQPKFGQENSVRVAASYVHEGSREEPALQSSVHLTTQTGRQMTDASAQGQPSVSPGTGEPKLIVDSLINDLVTFWNDGRPQSALERIGNLLDSPVEQVSNVSKSFMRLLRGTYRSLRNEHELGLKDFAAIVVPVVEEYSLRPQTSNQYDFQLVLCAASWPGNTSLCLGRLTDAIMAWTWAVIATLSQRDRIWHTWEIPLVSSMIYDMNKVKSFSEQHTDLFDCGTMPESPLHLLQTAYANDMQFIVEILESAVSADVLKVPTPGPGSAKQQISAELVKRTQPNLFSQLDLRWDRKFSATGLLEIMRISTLNDEMPSRNLLPQATLAWFMRLDYTSTTPLHEVMVEAQNVTRQERHHSIRLRGTAIFYTIHLNHPPDEGHAKAVIRGELFRLSAVFSNGAEWGVRFKSTFQASRRPGKQASPSYDGYRVILKLESDDIIHKTIKEQAVRLIRAADERLRLSKAAREEKLRCARTGKK